MYSNTATESGGGITNRGVLTIANTTMVGNAVATASGAGGLNNLGNARVTNVTVANNRAPVTSYYAGILNATGFMTIANTIVANNIPGKQYYNNGGTMTDGGNNLIYPVNDASCPGTFTVADPKLGPLTDKGDGILTLGLLNGAAIDSGKDAYRAAAPVYGVDERGSIDRSEFNATSGLLKAQPGALSAAGSKVGILATKHHWKFQGAHDMNLSQTGNIDLRSGR
jgi:hypothetical protein